MALLGKDVRVLCVVTAISALVACKEDRPASSRSAASATSAAPSTSGAMPGPGVACGSRSRTGCLASTGCVLTRGAARGEYVCRDALGPCEVGHAQEDKKACASIAGCTYDPGGCYCRCRGYGKTSAPDDDAPECKCDCANGAPGVCRAVDAPVARGAAPAGFVLVSQCWQQGTAVTTHTVTIDGTTRSVEVRDGDASKGRTVLTPREVEPLAKILGAPELASFARETPVRGVPHPGMTGCDLTITSPTLSVSQHWSRDDTFSNDGQAVRARLYVEIDRAESKVTKR